MKTFFQIYGFLQVVTFLWWLYFTTITKPTKKYARKTFMYWWDYKGLGFLCFWSAILPLLAILIFFVNFIFNIIIP